MTPLRLLHLGNEARTASADDSTSLTVLELSGVLLHDQVLEHHGGGVLSGLGLGLAGELLGEHAPFFELRSLEEVSMLAVEAVGVHDVHGLAHAGDVPRPLAMVQVVVQVVARAPPQPSRTV